MAQLFADAARAYLSAGIAAGDTNISITAGSNLFPVATGTDWFKAVLQDASGIEIVYVTAHTSGAGSFTVTRGQEGTTARSFAAGSVFGIRVTSADMAGFAAKLSDAPSDGKTYGRKDGAWAEVVSGGGAIAGPRNWYFSQHTTSSTFVVPAGVSVIRPYAFGAGAAGTQQNSGGGGGCAYGDIAVTPGATVTLSIAAGVANVTYGGVDLLTANPASGVTGGTASNHASVTNGGAYSGGAGAASSGGASSGSPLGAGVSTNASGSGSGWGGPGSLGGGGGVGGTGTSAYPSGGPGLPMPSTEPILVGLNGLGGTAGHPSGSGGAGGPGAGGGLGKGGGTGSAYGGAGGFGAGGGGAYNTSNGSGIGGPGGFGGGGGRGDNNGGAGSSNSGGAGGFGGGGGQGRNGGGAGGAAVIRIYY